jgi:putative transposase
LPKPNTATLYETVNPWLAYGLPDLLIVDNAKEMIGSDLLAACGQLGITLECMPVRTPWFKGHIERFFRTNNTGLIHTLPGTTFSNILDRGDYDVFQHACISLKAFIKLLHIFLLDVYAQSMHEGLGAIPAHRWQESIAQGFMPMLHTSAQETKIFLMHSDTRTVQRSGIEFEGLFYRSPDLARLRTLLPSQDRTVRIKFDPEDISTLYVSDPVDHRWIAVQAAGQAYAQGLSLWKHQIIRRYARHHNPQVDIEGLAAAKAYIQRIAVEEFVLTQQGRGRKEAARFLGVGIHDPVSVDLAVVSQTPSNELTSQPSLSSDRTAPSKPRKSSQKKSSQLAAEEVTAVQTSSTPASTDNDIDLAGWGGDYHLPLV